MSSTNLKPSSEFRAVVTERDENGRISSSVKMLRLSQLPAGAVLIRARWSSLNFKDALAATGHPGVVRRYPHVPGIDVAGEVVDLAADRSQVAGLSIGDPVIVTGYELGAGQWGGWAEFVSVPAEWVIPCPATLSLREAMVLGTAGFTAAMCVETLQAHQVAPDGGAVVVTGATGGVGCLAVHLLAKLGYAVVAVTGKSSSHHVLKDWGAREVLDRASVVDTGGKPLLPARWAGAVDTVGGTMLATLVRQIQPHGCVAACGLVGGTDLPLTVYPFILRGVTLAGVDSAWYPYARRRALWQRLAGEWRMERLEPLVTETTLDEVTSLLPRILAGELQGRTVVQIP